MQGAPWCQPDWECAESLARNVMIARAARIVILSSIDRIVSRH